MSADGKLYRSRNVSESKNRNPKKAHKTGPLAKKKFNPEWCKQLIEWMKAGNSFPTFATQIPCAIDTLYKMRDEYPEFQEAYSIGKAFLLKIDEQMGTGLILGKIQGSAPVYIHRMKCRYRDIYGDAQTQAQSQLPEGVTNEQLDLIIQQELSLLKT
jgi:hypothetical protein